MKPVNSMLVLVSFSLCATFLAFSPVAAQYAKYKPGDRVEVMFSGRWQPGTVMPLAKNDLNRTGSKLRIKIDSMADYLQPEGTEIMAEDVRDGGAPSAETAPAKVAPPSVNEASRATASYQHSGSTFKPGDRVEAIWNGRSVTGTVVPLSKFDTNRTGSKLRVKIDGLADYLQPEGTEIMTEDVKHSGAPVNHDTFRNGLPAAWNPGTAPIKPGTSTAPKPPAQAGDYVGKRTAESPKMNGNVPNMTGTAWKMLYDRAVNVVPVIRFTHKGRYDTVRYGLAAGMQGAYHQNGSRLTLERDNYNMSFDPATNILRLDADGDKLKLLYDGTIPD